VPPNYPQACTDDELTATVRDLGLEILKSGARINDVMRIQPLMAVGQTELQLRLIKRLSDQVDHLQDAIKTLQDASEASSRRLAWLSIALVVLTAALVGVTIGPLVP
nr:hypothetical protein [Actinomycetota bacterium]